MFYRAESFNGDMGQWNVANVETMSSMFAYAHSFDGDLTDWDVGNVTNMGNMFGGARSFNGDLSGWDVSNVKTMDWMFKNATAFDQDLGAWDVSGVTAMEYMLDASGLSTANYDATLNGWAALGTLQRNVELGAADLTYCDSGSARGLLEDDYEWNIVGDAQACVPAHYILTVDEQSPTAGGDVVVTARLASVGGTPIAEAGRTVQWTATGGGSFGSTSAATDAAGVATVTFTTATAAGTEHIVTATDDGDPAIVGDSPVMTTQTGAAAQYLVTVSDTAPVSGTDVTVTAQLADVHGNPVAQAGRTVHWTASGGGSFDSGSTVTDAAGIATVTFTTATGVDTEHIVTVTDDNDSAIAGQSLRITTQVGAASQYIVMVSDATPFAAADVTVRAQRADVHGNPIAESGHAVHWTSTNGGDFSAASTATDGDGMAWVTFTTAATPGIEHVITATDADVRAITGYSPTIILESPIDLGLDGTFLAGTNLTRMADGEMAASIAVQLKDQNGDNFPQSGIQVRFATTLGQFSSTDIVLTDEDGLAQVMLTSLDAGEATVTAEVKEWGANDWHPVVNGSPVKVTFLMPDDALAITQSVNPTYAGIGEPITVMFTVHNGSREVRSDIVITDHLPEGFHLDPASFGQGIVLSDKTAVATVASAAQANSGTSIQLMNAPPIGVFDEEARAITWIVGSLSSGESISFSFTGTVKGLPEGTRIQNFIVAGTASSVSYSHSVAHVYIGDWPSMHVTKAVDMDSATIGDVVRYVVALENETHVSKPVASSDTYVVDRLPVGFVYVEGSTLLDGKAATDPTVNGRTLVWHVGDVTPGMKRRVEYAAAVSLAATDTDGVNTVRVGGLSEAGLPYVTEPAEARVVVKPGMFGADGMIVGSVFIDYNGNGMRDFGEPGAAGARLVTDEGVEIVADEHGLFSLKGLYPGVHALGLVAVDIPGGADYGSTPSPNLEVVGTATQLVRVPVSGLATIDFAVPADPGNGDGEILSHRDAAQEPNNITVGLIDVLVPIEAGAETGRKTETEIAFFTKRELDSGTRVTVRYSTRPSLGDGDRAFPDWIQTGDSSRTRDLAPSPTRGYLYVEGKNSALLYGDYVAPMVHNRFVPQIGKMTGWLATAGTDSWGITAFTTDEQTAERYDEIPLEGVSGPYRLEHAPLIPGSETVWLLRVRTDDRDEIEANRARLKPEVDFVLDPRTGNLWLSNSFPRFNADGTRNIIAVHYRAVGGGAAGDRTGFRVNVGADSRHPVGFTWTSGTVGDAQASTVGLDGQVPVGETALLTYELGAQSDSIQSGRAVRLEWETNSPGRFNFKGSAQHVVGTMRTMRAGNPLAEGLTVEGGVSYRLSAQSTLTYVRGFRRIAPASDRDTDTLRLSTRQSNLHHFAEWRSQRHHSPKLTSSEVLRFGTEWTISDRQSIAASGQVTLRGDSASLQKPVVIPATTEYRLQLADWTALEIGYRAAGVDSSPTPQWTVSLGTNRRDRPNVYGSYRFSHAEGPADGLRNSVLIGLGHAWEPTRDLRISVSAEHALTNQIDGNLQTTTLSWSAGYSGFVGHELLMKHEMVAGEQAPRHAVTLSAQGVVTPDWDYALRGRWHEPVNLTPRETITHEYGGSISYRDRDIGRNTVLAQVVGRVYGRLNPMGVEDTRRVTVLGVDWAHRFANDVRLTSKIGMRQLSKESTPGGGQKQSFWTQAVLYQLSAHLPLGDRWAVELFGRHIVGLPDVAVSGGAVEVLYEVLDNVEIGLGFSNVGMSDPDLWRIAPWTEGLYVRIRSRF